MKLIDRRLDIDIGLSMLAPRERKVILLYYFEEMTEREISKILALSQQRINTLKKKALLKLRKFLN